MRFAEVGSGLRSLEVDEERELAGKVAGLLYLTAAATVPLLLVMPGVDVDSAAAVLACSGYSVVWGVLCLTVIRWPTVHPLISHFSNAMGLVLTAITVAATGGADSPARFYLLFVVVYASYFYPPKEAVPHLLGCVAVLLLPLAYDPHAVDAGLLAETMVLAPAFLALGALIMAGKQVMVELSRHDPLTGLLNRRVFEQRLGGSLDGRSGRHFGLMLCDLVSFKSVNDRHGHPEGDRVLRETAAALQASVRTGDVVARLGGDEFAVVVAGADDPTMRALASRLRAALRDYGAKLGLGDFELEASIGWAVFPTDATSGKELVAHADQALRDDKHSNGARGEAAAVGPSRPG
jgi:diguanylate cyclase (GGDEF)-like protein